jgi:hypothetical protein
MVKRQVWQMRIDPELIVRIREAAYQDRVTIAELADRALHAECDRIGAKSKPKVKPKPKA